MILRSLGCVRVFRKGAWGVSFFSIETEPETPVVAPADKPKRTSRTKAQIEADKAAAAAFLGAEHQEPAKVTLEEAQEVADSLVDAAPAA